MAIFTGNVTGRQVVRLETDDLILSKWGPTGFQVSGDSTDWRDHELVHLLGPTGAAIIGRYQKAKGRVNYDYIHLWESAFELKVPKDVLTRTRVEVICDLMVDALSPVNVVFETIDLSSLVP
jgi:hypothetical protein